jgi:hypothetical protein
LTDGSKNSYNWFGPLTRAPKNQRTGSKNIPQTTSSFHGNRQPLKIFKNPDPEVLLKILKEPELEVLRF